MEGVSKKRKLFISLAVVVVVAMLGIFGTFAAFTATTTNTGNAIASGTVKIDQHTGATTLYNLTEQPGGQVYSACVRVAYTGSLASSVKLYSSAITGDGTAFNLKVERGSGITAPAANMNCTGFAASSTLFDADLGTFATNYTAGQPGKAAGAAWAQNDTVDYKFTVTTKDGVTPGDHETAKSVAAHGFTFEARNN